MEVGGFVTRPVQALALVLDTGLSARASTPARAIFSAAIDLDVLPKRCSRACIAGRDAHFWVPANEVREVNSGAR